MAMNRIFIAPTGDEILNGIVRDIDSPEIISQSLAAFPQAEITRIKPIPDIEHAILATIEVLKEQQPDLIIFIGGSGGGHRFSKSLSADYTHSALEKALDEYSSYEIYGKNGHMWCKLVIGKLVIEQLDIGQKKDTILLNVPGPYVEAKAAYGAFLKSMTSGLNLKEINRAMAEAVLTLYPDQTEQPV